MFSPEKRYFQRKKNIFSVPKVFFLPENKKLLRQIARDKYSSCVAIYLVGCKKLLCLENVGKSF